MRVCLVSREVAPFYGAGIGTYVASMARAWAEAGHEAHVLTEPHAGIDRSGTWEPHWQARFRRVRFHVVPQAEVRRALGGKGPGFLRYSRAACDVLERLHEEHRFDYVEFPEYWAEGLFALRARRRGAFEGVVVALRLHSPTDLCRELNGEPMDEPEIASLVESEYEAMALADALVSPTRALLEIVTGRLGDRAPAGFVVPYPFFCESPGSGGVEEGRSETCTSVLFVGRLERRKGVDLLVEAGQRLLSDGADARFRLIGGDTRTGPGGASMRVWLESRIDPRWHDRFEFAGPMPRERVQAAMREATVCCFPSLWENFPNVCLEAMSLGACVVGSDAGGMSEIIKDGVSGLLFRSGDVGDLAAALGCAISNDDLRRRICAAAPARVRERCDPGLIVQGMEALVAGLAERPARPPT